MKKLKKLGGKLEDYERRHKRRSRHRAAADKRMSRNAFPLRIGNLPTYNTTWARAKTPRAGLEQVKIRMVYVGHATKSWISRPKQKAHSVPPRRGTASACGPPPCCATPSPPALSLPPSRGGGEGYCCVCCVIAGRLKNDEQTQ